MKTTANRKTRSNRVRSKKVSKKTLKQTSAHKKSTSKSVSKPSDKSPTASLISLPSRPSPSQALDDSRVFTIEIDSIRAETTIGDLIVAFPRTRDVLMKHGLTFDVEEAGYLYMTLNVFSAIHGLVLTGLLQELDIASKEMPPAPLTPPTRQIAIPPTA